MFRRQYSLHYQLGDFDTAFHAETRCLAPSTCDGSNFCGEAMTSAQLRGLIRSNHLFNMLIPPIAEVATSAWFVLGAAHSSWSLRRVLRSSDGFFRASWLASAPAPLGKA